MTLFLGGLLNRRSLTAIAATAALAIPFSAAVAGLLVDRFGRDIREQQRTTAALCVLRADLERRVRMSREFLAENPQGIPGIPSAVLRKSIADQQRTVDALAPLDCP